MLVGVRVLRPEDVRRADRQKRRRRDSGAGPEEPGRENAREQDRADAPRPCATTAGVASATSKSGGQIATPPAGKFISGSKTIVRG